MRKVHRTADQNWVREHNLSLLFKQMWDADQPISLSLIRQKSGLNKSTVGNILAQLQEVGLVRENGKSGSHPGRPGVLVEVNPDAGSVIGVELGVRIISVICTDFRGGITWKEKIDTTGVEDILASDNIDQAIKEAAGLVDKAIEHIRTRGCRLFGIGVAISGLVDSPNRNIVLSPHLEIINIPLQNIWTERFGVPVLVENDANAAALAEHMLGVARNSENFVYLSTGIGLGGGLVIGTDLYKGTYGFAGEIGHVTIDPNGPQCTCGNKGCWERYISPEMLIRRLRDAAAQGLAPTLVKLCNGNVNEIRFDHLLQAACENEPEVIDSFAEVGKYLGLGIATLISIFNPSLIVLGGRLGMAGDFILPYAEQEINRRVMRQLREKTKVVLSTFISEGPAMGGVTLILREIKNNPIFWQDNIKAV